MSISIGCNVTTDNMFHDLRDNTGQTNRSVVRTQNLYFLPFFKCRNNICLPPIAWHCPFIHRFLKDDSLALGYEFSFVCLNVRNECTVDKVLKENFIHE